MSVEKVEDVEYEGIKFIPTQLDAKTVLIAKKIFLIP